MQRFGILVFIVMIISQSGMMAQDLAGEYYLTGIPETGSGFKFYPDGNFEFYFVYGAVDRFALGTYTVEGDSITLQSDKAPGSDFTIISQKKKGKGYRIHVQEENPVMASNVRCLYFIGDTRHEAIANDQGVITLDVDACDRIYVQHLLFPDIATELKSADNSNNQFEIALSPDLQKVSFKGIVLTRHGDELTCLPNYFMPFEHIRYVKHRD